MGRSRNVFAGVIIGLLMIPGSIGLHAWNEYRTIHRTHGLNEAEHDVVSVDANRVASDHHGKLVHLSGQSNTDDILTDKEFGISENAVHLRRNVEMYQWVESEHGKSDKKQYSYDLQWEDGRVDSESFEQTNGHENPDPRFNFQSSSAKTITVGAYQLNDALRNQMQNWQDIEIPDSVVAEAMPDQAENFTVLDNRLYWSEEISSPSDPKLGDLRISFEHVEAGEISLVAKLADNSFETYRTNNGETLERLYDGVLSADDVFANLKTENTAIAWAIRVGGTFMCVFGVFLIFGPIQKLFGWIPWIGGVAGSLLFVAAMLIGFSISLLTISISWIAVRPLMGIGLLLAAAALFFLLTKLGSKAKAQQPDVTLVTDDMLVK